MSQTVPLGDLMAVDKRSIDPRKSPDEVFELYSIPAFDAGAPISTSGAAIGSPKQVVLPGDVLLSKIVPHIRRAWVVPASAGPRAIGSSEWIIFRGESFYSPYLRQVLVSDRFHSAFMTTVAGVGGSLLRARPAYVAKIRVPLPPIEEQRRIAAVLDQADELRAKRQTAHTLLDSLNESIFLGMFGDPAVNEHNHSTAPLGDLALKFSDGPFGSNLKSSHYVETGVRVVRLQNIGVGRFVDEDAAYIAEDHFNSLRKHECLPGDVLVGTLGDPNLRACVQPPWLERALNKADCVQVRVDPSQATAEWLTALLNLPSTERLAQALVLGQTRARISMGRLRTLKVPVPPLRDQKVFAARVAEIGQQDLRLRRSLAEFSALSTALQQRAFAGQL